MLRAMRTLVAAVWVAAAVVYAGGSCAAAAAADDAKAAALAQALADGRRAMAQRDLDAAGQFLKVASENAQTQAQQDEVARLRSLLDYLRQFWDLLEKGAGKLEGGEELVVGKTRVAFVEARGGEIVVKADGQIHRYTLKTVPSPLAMALAERSFAKEAVSKVVVGAFLAMDAKGDRQQARRLLDDAVKAGLDVGDLLPELETVPGGKLPLPADETKLKVAESEIHQEYKHLYSRMGIAVWQDELIRRLLADAPKVADDPVKRFVILRDVRDMAAAAGKCREAEQAIDLLDRYFQVDVVRMKLDVMQKLAESARGLDLSREVALKTLRLAEEAAKAGRLEDAQAAAKIAVQAARKTKNRLLMQQAALAEREIEQLRKGGAPQ